MLLIDHGWPPAYARVVGSDGPIVVLTFRTADPEFYELAPKKLAATVDNSTS